MKQKLFTRNFTLLLLGQTSSLFGNYILRLALSMYILEVTGSAATFAGILSVAMVPTILLSPFGGMAADRMDKGKLMVALDTLTGLAVLWGSLWLSGENAIAVIRVLLVVLSVLGAFETPTVQACIPGMLAGDNIVRGNALVNQVASISFLTAPLLGGILYGTLGIKRVMELSVAFFFVTSLLECLIRLEVRPAACQGSICSLVKADFLDSIRFLARERTDILHMLLLAAVSRFFVMGVTLVGLPFLVRTLLGLDAAYYGGAESILAVATILGSIGAGLLTGRLGKEGLSLVMGLMGLAMIPAGVAFLVPAGPVLRYGVVVASFCGMQAAVSVFSIFAVSMIQQNTPDHLMGKVMAFTSAITLCAQPLGQMVYGWLFDGFREAVYLVLVPTGVVVCMTGLLYRR